MAAAVKFFNFTEQLIRGVHDWDAHVFKIYLSNATPDQTLDLVKADLAEIAGGNGYTAGGHATTISIAEASGVTTVQGTQVVITAAGGTIGPFRYAVLFNDTAASKDLIQYWDYGSAITLNDGEPFTVKFNNAATGTILTLT